MEGQYVRCLMVETGEEKTVLQLLRVLKLGRGIFPQRIRVRKIRGAWRKDRIRLLPGYVFVFTDEEVPIWRYQWMEHVLKVLRYDKEPDGYLRGWDLEFAKTICELDGKLDILNAVDEAGFIRVTDLLLSRLHGEVLSVQKGKRQVHIRVNLMGQPKVITLNYQLLDNEGRPLEPAAEMLDDESDEWLTAWTPDFEDEVVEQLDRELGLGEEETEPVQGVEVTEQTQGVEATEPVQGAEETEQAQEAEAAEQAQGAEATEPVQGTEAPEQAQGQEGETEEEKP